VIFMVHCVKLMLRSFEFGVLLFDYFVCRQNVICLKHFTGYGHYAGEVEDIIIAKLAIISEIVVPKIRAFSWGLIDDPTLKSGWLFVDTVYTFCIYIATLLFLLSLYFRAK